MEFEIIYHNIFTLAEYRDYIYSDNLKSAMQFASMNRHADEIAYISSDESDLAALIDANGEPVLF